MRDLWDEAAKQCVRNAQEQAAKRALQAGRRPLTEEEHQRMLQMSTAERFAFAFARPRPDFAPPRPDDDAPNPPGA